MQTNETILQAYQRMDEEICTIEQSCPGPRLATAEAWIDHLESLEPEPVRPDDMVGGNILQQRPNENTMENFGQRPDEEGDDLEVIQPTDTNDSTLREKENQDVIKVRHVCEIGLEKYVYKFKYDLYVKII